MAAYGTGPIERRDLDWAPPVCTCNDNNQTWSRVIGKTSSTKMNEEAVWKNFQKIIILVGWVASSWSEPERLCKSRRHVDHPQLVALLQPSILISRNGYSNDKENCISINHKMGKPVELYLSPPIAPVPLYRSLSGGKEYSKIFSNQWNIVYLKSWARQDSMCDDALKYTNLKVWKIYQSIYRK